MKRIFGALFLVALLAVTVIALQKVDAQSPNVAPATTATSYKH